MVHNYVKVQLTSLRRITVVCFSSMPRQENLSFTLFNNDNDIIKFSDGLN